MTSVAERLGRRIEVLTKLVIEADEPFVDDAGEEIEVNPPRSLNKCRLWEEPSLGIERIGDPASFTRDHPRHGSKVREIESLIRRLPKSGGRARAHTATKESEMLRRQLADAKDLIVKLTGQLAAKNEELSAERGLRIDTERVLQQARERERRSTRDKGRTALSLVTTEGQHVGEDGP